MSVPKHEQIVGALVYIGRTPLEAELTVRRDNNLRGAIKCRRRAAKLAADLRVSRLLVDSYRSRAETLQEELAAIKARRCGTCKLQCTDACFNFREGYSMEDSWLCADWKGQP